MATTVQSRLLTPTGAAAGLTVLAQLVAPGGWLTDHTGEIVQQAATVSATDGSWSLSLTPQSQIAASGTYYAITVPASGLVHTCVVPTTGPVQLADILVNPTTLSPVSPTQPGLYVPTTRLITAGTGLTGGGDLTADRTLTVAYGTTTGTAAAGNDSRLSVRPYAPVTLTDAATITTDASLGTHFRVTLGGNRALAAPTNPTDGQKILYAISQDATGNRTLALDPVFNAGLVTVTLSTAANKTDYLGVIYRASATKWDALAFQAGF